MRSATVFGCPHGRKRAGKALRHPRFPGDDRGYHVHPMKIVAPHFASTEPAFICEVKTRLDRAHLQPMNIPVDIPEMDVGRFL